MIDYRENNKWTVYVHIIPKEISNYDYDKYYVGITSMKPRRRWGSDGRGYKNNKHFYNAIQKYGWNNIEHNIVAENLTENEACNIEKTLIHKLDTCNSKYGYNHNTGGSGCNGHIYTDDERKILSIRMSGENNPYYNKKHSEETRMLMRENHYDCSGSNHPRAKEVFQFTFSGEFVKKYDTCTDAGKELHIGNEGISIAATKNQSCHGFLWVYKDNVIQLPDGTYQIKEYKYNPKNPRYRTVYQFDRNGRFIKQYISAMEASREINIPFQTIASSASHKYKKCKEGNFLWRYEEDVVRISNETGVIIQIKQ